MIAVRERQQQFVVQWLILACALAVVAALGAFQLYQERDAARERESERLATAARIVQLNLEQNLTSTNEVLADLAFEFGAAPHAGDDLNRRLKTLTEAMPSVRTITAHDRNGRIVATSRPELIALNQDFTQRQYFKIPKENPSPQTLYVSAPFRNASGVFSLTVTRMIAGPRGDFNGVVVATLDPVYFDPLLASVRYTADMVVSLVHGDGVVFLNASDAPYAVVGRNLSQPGSFFTRHKESGLEATTFTGTLLAIGERRMLAHRNVQPERLKMDKPMVVATSRRLDAILAPWQREAAISSGAYLLAAIASAWALHAYQRRHRQFLRKESEAAQALHASERLMKMVTDNVPGMIGYWNDRMRCEFANAAYLEWFGRTSQEMRGISMQELMGPELFAKNEPYIRAALRGEPQEFERTLTKADGSTGYTYAHYVPDSYDGTVRGFFVLVSDVTRVKLAELALAESEARLKAIIETAPECVTVIAPDGKLLQMNRAGLDMIEADSEAQVLGTDALALAAPEHRAGFADLHRKLIHGESGALEFEIVSLKGRRRWAAMHAVPMRDALGRITGALGITHDISERRKVALELERLANTDSLTGLDNRRQFVSRVEHEIARTLRFGGPLSMLMLDVDHFKRINDTCGHRTGDQVLQQLAGICARSLRDIDIIGRIGGEEFAIALPQTGGDQAREVAERIRQAIAQAEIATEHGTPVKITASIGIAAMGSAPGTVDTLLGEADKALYLAKELGRNRVCAYAGGD